MSISLLLAAASAIATPLADGKPPLRPKVLVIGVDGVRVEALVAADTPAIDELAANGCMTLDASTSSYTVSGPGWSDVLCGVWPDKHRVTDNRFLISDYERYPSMFTLAKRANPKLHTAYFGNWGPIGERILAKDPIDVRVSLKDPKDDAPQSAACVKALRDDGALDLVFYYIGGVDETGHAIGFNAAVPGYRSAIEAADARVGLAMSAIEARPTFDKEDWLVILTCDHGGTIDLNHGRDIPEHRRIAFIVSGDAAAKGALRGTVNQVDVVATALAHLGIAADPAWDLDSHAVGLARGAQAKSTATAMFGRNLVVNGDAEMSSPAETPEGNRGVAAWTDLGAVSTLAYGAHKDFPTAETPGSPHRGKSFFFGGNAGESRIVQRVDLAPVAKEIDAATVPFECGAWLGGFSKQRDIAWLELRWLDERGGEVGRAELAAVGVEERTEKFGAETATGFIERRAGGVVPAGARVAEITLRFERSEGVCDGYADDISLVLRPEVAVLDCGPAICAPAADAMTVWMRAGLSPRTTAEGRALRCIAEGDGGGEEIRVESAADPERDGTARFELHGLVEGARYAYRIERVIDGVTIARGSFTPLAADTTRTRVAFGSCADIDDGTANAWRAIARATPDALVLLGDTPYIDSAELAAQRAKHRAFASADAYEALVGSTPLYSTWDDHDFGKNDTDGRMPGKDVSRRVFLEYRTNASAGDGTEGVYSSFRSGPMEVFVLDTRSFAKTAPSKDDAKQPTLLGETQWKWLEAQLAASTAPVKVIASSMVFNNRVRPLKPDYWGAYPAEFERLQRLIASTKATGVVLISGDVHRTRVVEHKTKALAGYDLVELVTSPLHARVHADAAVAGPEVVFDAGVANSFLLLDARDDAVTARFVAANGRCFHERTIDMRTLR